MVQDSFQKAFLKSFITLTMVVASEIVLATLTLSVISANQHQSYQRTATDLHLSFKLGLLGVVQLATKVCKARTVQNNQFIMTFSTCTPEM